MHVSTELPTQVEESLKGPILLHSFFRKELCSTTLCSILHEPTIPPLCQGSVDTQHPPLYQPVTKQCVGRHDTELQQINHRAHRLFTIEGSCADHLMRNSVVLESFDHRPHLLPYSAEHGKIGETLYILLGAALRYIAVHGKEPQPPHHALYSPRHKLGLTSVRRLLGYLHPDSAAQPFEKSRFTLGASHHPLGGLENETAAPVTPFQAVHCGPGIIV